MRLNFVNLFDVRLGYSLTIFFARLVWAWFEWFIKLAVVHEGVADVLLLGLRD